MRRLFLCASIGLLGLLAPFSFVAMAGTESLVNDSKQREKYEQQILAQFEKGEFDKLDAEADRIRSKWERETAGLPKLMFFYAACKLAAEPPKVSGTTKRLSETEADERAAKALEWAGKWVETKPDSATAKIVLANILHKVRYVSKLEGTEEQRMNRVRMLLDEAEKTGVKDPAILHLRLNMLQEEGADLKVQEAMLDKILAIQPCYSLPAVEIARRLAGDSESPTAWVQFAERLTEKTRATEGDGMYARMFWSMMISLKRWNKLDKDPEIFRRNSLSWPRIRQGFRDLDARYPGSQRLLNYFAYYACLAEDWDTAHAVFNRLGDRWDDQAWWLKQVYDSWRAACDPSTRDFQRKPWGQISGIVSASVFSIAFSPNGKTLAIGYGNGPDNGDILLWDMEEQRARARWHGHQYLVTNMAFSPDGKTLVSGDGVWQRNKHGIIKLWDPNLTTEIDSIQPKRGGITYLSFSADGDYLGYTTDNIGGGMVGIRNLKTKKDQVVDVGRCSPLAVAFSPTRPELMFVGCWSQIVVWDTIKQQKIDAQAGEFSPSATDGQKKQVPRNGFLISELKFSPDGKTLALPRSPGFSQRTFSGGLTFFDMQELRPKPAPVMETTGGISSVAWSPDGTVIATAGYDTNIKLWDPSTGKEIVTLYGHFDKIQTIEFSPKGRFLASCSQDRVVRLWDIPAILKQVREGR